MGRYKKRPGTGLLSGAATRLFTFCLFLTFLILTCNTSSAQSGQNETRTVEATGLAAVIGTDAAAARDAALGDALRKATEQAVGTIVSSETMVENYQVLSDSVYTKSRGYVKGYTISSEGQSQNLYQVTVKATVAIGELKDDLEALGLLQRKAERPRVLFLIAEKNIGHKYFVFWWWGRSEYKGETVDMSAAESSLKGLFIDKGFSVVEAIDKMDEIKVSDALRIADLTTEGARSIGKDLKAEIVVYGKALAREGPRTDATSKVGSYLADVTIQALRVDDGAVLGAASAQGSSRHISEITGGSEAISRASIEAGNKVIGQIASKWTSSQSVTLTLKGVTDYKQLTELKNAIRSRVRGVTGVYQRRFEGDEAVLELETRSSAQTIADDITRLKLKLRVKRTTPNTIEAETE